MSSNDGRYNILVLGAGVVGLTTAYQCHMSWPRAHVTVMADKFADETTSHGAGGIFRPTPEKFPGVPEQTLRRWVASSWRHFDRLVHSEEASLCGTQIISGYQFFNNYGKNYLEKDYVYSYRPLTAREMKMFPGTEGATHGNFVTTLMTEGATYMSYLTDKITQMGGKFVRHHLKSFEELADRYDVVFNCSGLGSRELLGDKSLIPIRGQLIKVRAPWIKHSFLYGDDQLCFVYPGHQTCVVGVTRQKGDADLNPRDQDSDRMWRTALTFIPSLKRAERLSDWVGLRPHRDPLRVETEVMQFPLGSVKVVHNYGHGAEGIGMSWATSEDAIKLADEILSHVTTVQSKL